MRANTALLLPRSRILQAEEAAPGGGRNDHALGRPIVADGEIHASPVGGGEIAGLLEEKSGGR